MARAFTLERLTVDAYRESQTNIGQLLKSLGHDLFLDAMTDEELVDHLVTAWTLEPIEWDSQRSIEYGEDIVATTTGSEPRAPLEPVRLLYLPVVPKHSNRAVLALRPEKGWVQRGPDIGSSAALDERESVIVLRGTQADLNNFRGTAETLVRLINEDVTRYFRELRPAVRRDVTARREQIRRQNETLQNEAKALGASIRPRSDRHPASNLGDRAENAHRQRQSTSSMRIAAADSARNAATPSRDEAPTNLEGAGGEHRSPLSAFIAYARADERLLNRFRTHLSALRREGKISDWHDREIRAGQDWEGKIEKELEEADLVLLLVSPDFINSNYCYDKEMTRALERHNRGTATVVPVIVRPADWKSTPLGKLQAVPRDAKPVVEWRPQDKGWVDAVAAIRKLIEGPMVR